MGWERQWECGALQQQYRICVEKWGRYMEHSGEGETVGWERQWEQVEGGQEKRAQGYGDREAGERMISLRKRKGR